MEKEIIETQNKIQQFKKLQTEIEKLQTESKSVQEVLKEELKKIRLNRIQEINDEYERSKLRLKELEEKRKSILKSYCEKNGHKYNLIDSKFSYVSTSSSRKPAIGFNTYKCEICGITKSCEGYMNYPRKKYKEIIPNDIYNNEILTKDGETFGDLEKEILELNYYIDYLYSLILAICELFGHDSKKINPEYQDFKCNCCGKIIGDLDYINSHYNAKYRNVIDYYYEDDSGIIIEETSLPSVLSLPVMTFEEYKEFNKKQFEEIKYIQSDEDTESVNNNITEMNGTDFRKTLYKVSDYNSRAGSLKL